tara:strand:+ start:503 stop:1159 length:657 start_codon:yes stop_codon:yes gene_type:complete
MNRRIAFGVLLLILLTTITSQQKIIISKFNLNKIEVENNFLIEKKEIKKLLYPIYDKNLLFISNKKIKLLLMQNSFIESFKVKKKYPNTLKIRLFEKKPIAILIFKKRKFYLSDKIELIEFKNLQNYKNLPYVFGNREDFKIFYSNLKKSNFPSGLIDKYVYHESNRWDLETVDSKIIKLPIENYIESLENYFNLMNKNNFKKYEVFDYRINDQLILK